MAGQKFLLDTHALLWFAEDNPALSRAARDTIENVDNRILFSQISLLEIGIKMRLGKLQLLAGGLDLFYENALNDALEFLSLRNEHIVAYQQIPLLPAHRDPFDRLLIATAMVEGATILTADSHFSLYAGYASVLW